jgi:hypothetical protein
MDLTKNFTLAELNFRGLPLDETLTNNAQALAENLQAIRDFLGKPVIITSWYRPDEINRNAGGSKTSQHLYGEAVDFHIASLDAAGLDDLFQSIVDGNVKLPNACSQIIRETKGESEWIHMGIRTLRWIEAQKEIIASDADSAQKSKSTKRLTSCECLRTHNGVTYELVKYI